VEEVLFDEKQKTPHSQSQKDFTFSMTLFRRDWKVDLDSETFIEERVEEVWQEASLGLWRELESGIEDSRGALEILCIGIVTSKF
jgi:hypothetical protein